MIAIAGLTASPAFAQPQIEWQRDGRYGLVVVVSGVAGDSAAEYQDALRAYVGPCASADKTPAILSQLEIAGGEKRLLPRFALDPSGDYCAVLDLSRPGSDSSFDQPYTAEWSGNRTQSDLRVTAVLPAINVLPANTLRLYAKFSRPVLARDVHTWVRLHDDTQSKWVDTPFVEIPEGLWDSEGRRLTLIFHPGRIKRDVGPNLAMGPPLTAGHSYTLVIEPPNSQRFEHHFRAISADRDPIDPGTWQVSRSSQDTVRIDFGESLDPFLVERMVRLVIEGIAVEGPYQVSPSGDYMTVTHRNVSHTKGSAPGGATLGPIEILVHRDLEDLAGNRVGEAFEREISPPMPALDGGASEWILVQLPGLEP